MSEPLRTESILRLLKVMAKYESQDYLSWTEDLEFYIRCNDFFYWASADAEDIESEADIDMLVKAMEDAGNAVKFGDAIWGWELYCARHRGERPQDCQYDFIDEKLHPLFDACGPVRDHEMDNHPRKSGWRF